MTYLCFSARRLSFISRGVFVIDLVVGRAGAVVVVVTSVVVVDTATVAATSCPVGVVATVGGAVWVFSHDDPMGAAA